MSKETKNEETATFLCFYMDKKEEIGEFLFNGACCSDIKYKIIRNENFENYAILKIYKKETMSNFISNLNFFDKKTKFKIIYNNKDRVKIYESEEEFEIQNQKIKFFYNTEKFKQKSFMIPSCQNQYNTFSNLKNYKNELISNTFNFFKKYFDLNLYLILLNLSKNEELTNIIDNFQKLKYIYNKEKIEFNKKIINNLPSQYQKKFIIIYSAISDQINILNDKTNNYKEELEILFNYNKKQPDNKILIKENFFSYFIDKISSKDIKKFCNYCFSIPILFNILSQKAKANKLKIEEDKDKITYDDLPNIKSNEDDIIRLIEQYEKFKDMFKKNNEILRLWKEYLDKYKQKLDIDYLEKIKEKFISINQNFYSSIIEYISSEIRTMHKQKINSQELKGIDMYKYINEYNRYCDFFSDEELLLKIATNIDLKDLKKNSDSLKEYNNCKFLQKLDENRIEKFIKGILNNLKSFDELYLFFNIIYPLNPKIQDSSSKDIIITNLTISKFLSILNKANNK